ncbi:MAG: protein translocase subunit SecF [Candidatus Buchananbacteria bacterium]
MEYKIIQKRWINYSISILLALVGIISISVWGLKYGLDFTGGSLLQIKFVNQAPATSEQITSTLAPLDLGVILAQPVAEDEMVLRFKEVDEKTHQQIIATLNAKSANSQTNAKIEESSFTTIGPTISAELKQKTWGAMIIVLLAIILYVAFAFRQVSRPVPSWKYGVAAVIALAHDTLITVGLFSLLGHFAGIEVDSYFVTALLTLLGFSVHDTIVVFDRIRENLKKQLPGTFLEVVNHSVNDTIVRSINTSLTAALVVLALYFFGGASTKNFALAMSFGILIGTYSSIFIASPLVVDWHLWSMKKR